jgi:melanoma-associated antigen
MVSYVPSAVMILMAHWDIAVDLRANLKRLRLPPKGEIPFNSQATHKSLSIEAYLNLLTKQNYLDFQRVGEAKGAGSGKGKRGRAPAATQNNEDGGGTIEWRWGSRAHSEVGEQGIASFVAEFMVERMGVEEQQDEEEGSGRRGEKARQEAAQKRLDGVLKGIHRAAGGNLQEIK